MVDQTIGEIPDAATALALTDLMEIEQPDGSKQAEFTLLLALLFDNDAAMAANSANKAPTQAAVKTALAALFAATKAPKITSTIVSGTITPDPDTDLIRPSSSLTAALTIANPATAPVDAFAMEVELVDNGSARALTWGSMYESFMATLPTTTAAAKAIRIGFIYNAGLDKLRCVYVQSQP